MMKSKCVVILWGEDVLNYRVELTEEEYEIVKKVLDGLNYEVEKSKKDIYASCRIEKIKRET